MPELTFILLFITACIAAFLVGYSGYARMLWERMAAIIAFSSLVIGSAVNAVVRRFRP